MKQITFLAVALVLMSCTGCLAQIQGNKPPVELLGAWRNGSVSMLQNRDRITGATSAANGKTFSYEFDANGRYKFTGYMQSTMYNCSTSLYNEVSGTYQISGDEITLTQKTNRWQKQNSCSPQSDSTQAGKLVNETHRFNIGNDKDGKETLCLAQSNGEGWCFQKRNED